MTRRAQGPTPGQGLVAGARRQSPSRGAPQGACGATIGHAGFVSCDIARGPDAAAPRAGLREPVRRLAGPWLATLALLGLGIPAVHGQSAPVASAASQAGEPSPPVTPPASAASGRGRTMPLPLRGGSQSEAMQACRSLTGERAQHDCMLRHQAMPPYSEGEDSSGPPRRRP